MRTFFLAFLLVLLFVNWIGHTDTNGQTVNELARGDLASRLNVPIASVELVGQMSVNWPNACLGIRSPGFVCAQVVTPGYVLTFRVNGRLYTYNTSTVEAIFVG